MNFFFIYKQIETDVFKVSKYNKINRLNQFSEAIKNKIINMQKKKNFSTAGTTKKKVIFNEVIQEADVDDKVVYI